MQTRTWLMRAWRLGLLALSASACSGAGPDPALLDRHTPISAGSVCPAGGTSVQTGTDRNGNGTLDDDEVERTDSVCNPVAPASVVRIVDEPAGAHCAAGGHAVASGPDRNGNGVLDDDEVVSTTYACEASDIFDGDFTLEMWSAADKVAALGHARIVTGSLAIAPGAAASLPRLDSVVGSVTIATGAAPAELDLSALAHIGGSLVVDGSELDDLALPALTDVGGNVQLIWTPNLATASLPQLALMGGGIFLVQAPDLTELAVPQLSAAAGISMSRVGLTTLRLPRLQSLAYVEIDLASALSEVSLPALASVGRLAIRNAGRLRTLDLHALQACPGLGDTPSIDIESTGLTEISLPISSAAGAIWLSHNGALTAVHLPELGGGHGLELRGDTQLATLDAPHLTDVDTLSLSGPLTSLQIPGDIVIHNSLAVSQAGLAHLPAFRLERGATLSVTGNPALVDLRGLELPGMLKAITIDGNPLLTDLGGLESVAEVGFLGVARNPLLSSLAGLDGLAQASSVELRSNPALTSLVGLEHLTILGNYLMITDHAGLTSLEGLGALRAIGGALVVARNTALASIAGLAVLDSIGLSYGPVNGGPSIYFSENPALAAADVDALIARVHHN